MHAPFHAAICGLAMLVMVVACSSAPTTTDIWDSYDVRHETQNLPEPYIDNDSYYAAPDCSIIDAPSCGGD